VSLAADHEQVRAAGCVQQDLGRLPLHDTRVDHDIRREAADLGERLGERLSGLAFKVGNLVVGDRRQAVTRRTAQRSAASDDGDPFTPTTMR
jgi:hypothetical protein